MRILLVDELFPPVRWGGAEIAAREIATGLGRHHEVVMFTPSYGRPVGMEDAHSFRIFRYRNRFIPLGSLAQQKILFTTEMTKNLAAFARVFRPQIIHAQNALSAPSVAKVAEMHRILGIAHVRDHRFECFTSNVACRSHHDATLLEFARCIDKPSHVIVFPYAKLITKLVRHALQECARAFVVSNYLRHEMSRTIKIDARTCYDGVDLDKIRKIEPAREIAGRPFDPDTTITYAGGLHKSKGIFELLSSFRRVLTKMPNTLLLIAGDGPYREAARRFIETSKIEAKVILLGRLPYDDLISTIKASTAVVVPSLLPEAGSRLIMEALACAKPVLASNRGACPEMIGPAGATFSPDEKSIARAILHLLDDRQKIQELGKLAKERSPRFSLNVTCNQIIRGYEEWTAQSKIRAGEFSS